MALYAVLLNEITHENLKLMICMKTISGMCILLEEIPELKFSDRSFVVLTFKSTDRFFFNNPLHVWWTRLLNCNFVEINASLGHKKC